MKKILIIDGKSGAGVSYESLLLDQGFDVERAVNAKDASDRLISERFDLVLLDIDMVEAIGREMYEVIREYDRQIKVIVSSVSAVEDQVRSILGACAYHDKSQGAASLLETIKEAICQQK